MDYNLLIEFIPNGKFQKVLKFFPNYDSRKNFYLTQGKPFNFSLKITNIDTKVFPGANISQIDIRSAAFQAMHYPVDGQFKISQLNPNESADIFIANTVTLLEGLGWIECVVSPLENTDSITTFQKELSTGNKIKFDLNRWGQELFFIPKSQVSSSRLNWLVFLLAFLTFWDATLGIKNTILFCLNFVGKAMIAVGLHLSGK